jgi:hypothetical protein
LSHCKKVKAELAAKGNEYEILDFLKTNTRYMVGTEDLPAKDNALADDDTVNRRGLLDDIKEIDEDSDLQAEADINVANLPEKIDNFLVYINDMYFEGQLDLRNKGVLRDQLVPNPNDQSENNDQPPPRIVFNSDDSPVRQRRIYRSD